MNEIYKVLKGYNIEVSNIGNVRRISDGFMYSLTKHHSGYLNVSLSNISNNCPVHKLVYLVWNDLDITALEQSDLVIDHIDRNKENNNITNLRLVSQSTNALNKEKHSFKILFNTNSNECFITDNLMLFSAKYNIDYSVLYKIADENQKSYKSHNGWIVIKIDYVTDDINFIHKANKEDYSDIIESTLKALKTRAKQKAHTNVKATNIKTNEVYHFEYKDREDFASKFGLDCKKFIEVMNGRAKSHKGFKFEGID